MKVLLISVITENLYMTVLPLGAAYVAASAMNAGHEVEMLSLRSGDGEYNEILEKTISRLKPDAIGISMRNVDDQRMENSVFLLEPVKEVVKNCKKLSSSPVVLGGAGYSIFPSQALSYLGADMGIQGEGEASFTMLLKRLDKNLDISEVPGLYLPEKGLVSPIKHPKSLDEYAMPVPNVHLTIPKDNSNQPVWAPIQTRRGCPMDCSYCSTFLIEGRALRKHSPKNVVENIKKYIDAGINHIFFVDNTFNFPPSYAEELCDQIISEKLKIKGRCILYPSKIDAKLVDKMAKAGIRETSLGFESASEMILKNMNKRFLIKDVISASRMLKDAGIFQMGFLMLGGPGETKKTALASLRFADDLQPDAMKISIGIRIYPYTALAETAIKEEKIKSHEDLLFPTYYVVNELKDWLKETVLKWGKDRPNWMI